MELSNWLYKKAFSYALLAWKLYRYTVQYNKGNTLRFWKQAPIEIQKKY